MEEVLEARERTNGNRDSARANTIGMMRCDGDDRNGVQMTNDERDHANDSQAVTGCDIRTSRAFVARIS